MADGDESDWSSLAGNSPRRALEKLPQTAHDWAGEQEDLKKLRTTHPVYDDGTMTFFWYEPYTYT